jgi:hypothetical protein
MAGFGETPLSQAENAGDHFGQASPRRSSRDQGLYHRAVATARLPRCLKKAIKSSIASCAASLFSEDSMIDASICGQHF